MTKTSMTTFVMNAEQRAAYKLAQRHLAGKACDLSQFDSVCEQFVDLVDSLSESLPTIDVHDSQCKASGAVG